MINRKSLSYYYY